MATYRLSWIKRHTSRSGSWTMTATRQAVEQLGHTIITDGMVAYILLTGTEQEIITARTAVTKALKRVHNNIPIRFELAEK